MLALQQQALHFHFQFIACRPFSHPTFRPTITTVHHFPRAHFQTRPERLLAELPDPPTALEGQDGPVQLPPASSSSSSLFSDSDEPSPLQVATSVLLTGAISVFLFRSLRRRAKRSKEMRFRSAGAKEKGLKEDALDSLKAMQAVTIEPGKPPSAVQALLGAVSAGVIAVLLYKFTTTIEAALNRQAISDNFSLAINSPTEPSTSKPASKEETEPASEDPVNNVESEAKTSQQSSNDSQ